MLGGGEHSFLELLSRLSPSWKPIAMIPGKGDLLRRLQKKNIQTQVIPLPALRPWFVFEILSNLRSLFSVCKRYHPDFIYANGSRAAFYGGIIARILDLPVVWHCRITHPDIYLDFFLTRLCSHIVCNSHATAKRFEKGLLSKVTVIYNGLDLKWLKENTIKKPFQIKDEWKIILVVARISKWKRHDLALSAFEHIAKVDSKVHLICVGAKDILEPEWWFHLQELTRHSAFSDRIHWVGQVDDVRPWYRIAHMLVLASENEPFGRVLVEAMACGVPVIATKSGGVPEIVRHDKDGLLVRSCDDHELAKAIAKLLKNESLRKSYGQNAMERAEYFSLDRHVEKIVQVFNDVINKKKAAIDSSFILR